MFDALAGTSNGGQMVVYTYVYGGMYDTRSYIRARNKYTYACAHTYIYTNTVKVIHARGRPRT